MTAIASIISEQVKSYAYAHETVHVNVIGCMPGIIHDREDSILLARVLRPTCFSTSTNVSQVTGCFPLPCIHRCKISQLIAAGMW